MAVSADRFRELFAEYIEKVKKPVDLIDRKYSLDYKEPLIDMPESLNLTKRVFTPDTAEQLHSRATEQVMPSYYSALRKLDSALADDRIRIEQKLHAIEENARKAQAKLLYEFNAEVAQLRKKLTDHGILFSSVITKISDDARADYQLKVDESNTQADSERVAVEQQRQAVEEDYQAAVKSLADEFETKITSVVNTLKQRQQAEQASVDKYNTQLDEKEAKYQMARAKAYEQARQAEYDRSFAAKKLYQQMGAVGYEDTMLWEKYNVFVKYFANFTKREEALALIQADSFASGHLKQYYSTLLDWINRNIPA